MLMNIHKTSIKKLLNVCLLLTSLIGYLQWGKDNHTFLFQVEAGLMTGNTSMKDMLHPFILVPMLGQLLLLITLFQKIPGNALTIAALACLGIIMLFLFLIGLLSMNFFITLSTLPFIITGVLVVTGFRKNSRTSKRSNF